MKKNILSLLLVLGLFGTAFSVGDENENETVVILPVDKDFCTNLKKIIEASREGFESIKAEPTTRMISGEERPFFKTNVVLQEGSECYILNSEDAKYYPECECFIGKNNYAPGDLAKVYEDMKKAVKECLPTGWKFTEKDKTNDIYLEDTEFKKLIALEDVDGKKLKFYVFLNNNRVLGYWTVEFHFDGKVK